MDTQRSGELRKDGDAGRFGLHDPVHQQLGGGFLIVLFPDFVERVLEVIGRGQGLVEPEGFLQPLGFVTRLVQVFGLLQKQPANSFEHVLLHRVFELVIQGPPQLGEFLVVQLDHMKPIEYQRGRLIIV